METEKPSMTQKKNLLQSTSNSLNEFTCSLNEFSEDGTVFHSPIQKLNSMNLLQLWFMPLFGCYFKSMEA